MLLKLYRYNDYRLFNGADPNMICERNGELYIHPKLPYDLFLTNEDFESSVYNLKSEGLIKFSEVGSYIENLGSELRTRVAERDKKLYSDNIRILTPIFQWDNTGGVEYKCS